MKRVDEYITENEVKQFCENCYELCSRHCIIWRKAEMRYNEEKRKRRIKMIWIISGRNLPTLEIEADSFDEALKEARQINKNYDTGQVKENR